jgi:hypothetical protein
MRFQNKLAAISVVIACCGCVGASPRTAGRPQVASVAPLVPDTHAPSPETTLRTTAATPTTATRPENTISVGAQEALPEVAGHPPAIQPPVGSPSPPAEITSIFGRDAVLENVLGCVGDDKTRAPPSPAAPPTPCMRRILPPGFVTSGSVDKEIVRRVIRLHINEVKACYETNLIERPKLGGRMIVQFTVAASGEIVASHLQSSTMDNSTVESCVVQASHRWKFPKPLGGGIVVISYPFVLTASGVGE